jgi:hypothetical protein
LLTNRIILEENKKQWENRRVKSEIAYHRGMGKLNK